MTQKGTQGKFNKRLNKAKPYQNKVNINKDHPKKKCETLRSNMKNRVLRHNGKISCQQRKGGQRFCCNRASTLKKGDYF